jgi:hypothetical protein
MTKIEKNSTEKKINLFGSKTTIYLSLELHKGRPSYGRNLQLSKENIQYFKTCTFLNFFYFFCGSLLPSWIWTRIHWPESGFGSETLVWRPGSGSGSGSPFFSLNAGYGMVSMWVHNTAIQYAVCSVREKGL